MPETQKEPCSTQEDEKPTKRQGSNRKDTSLGKRITINVSGLRYETYDKTLERFPESLLGCQERRENFFDTVNNEYFFDRNRICFESILAYYQTCGVLIRPPNIPRKVFVNDLKYFDLGEQALRQAGDDLDAAVTDTRPMPENKIQRKIWSLFEHPDTSNMARVIAIFSVGVIILSIVLFCVETLPQFQRRKFNGTDEVIAKDKKRDAFFVIETFCIAWFTLEYLIRFLCSPNKCKFLVSVLNIIDLVAILPFFITLPMEEPTSVSSLAILRCVRLVRVFRIFKLSRYSRGLQILGHTLRASLRELGLLLFFLCVGVILFSSAIYYAEFGSSPDNDFLSIPHSFWWSIITMTTVGYGDMAPKTLGGKLVGSFCAITGVLAIALPVPVIVSNFAYYYSREHSKSNSSVDDEEELEEADKDVEIENSSASKVICFGRPNPIRIHKKKKKKKKKKTCKVNVPEIKVQTEDVNVAMDHQNGNLQNRETSKTNSSLSNGDPVAAKPVSNGKDNQNSGKAISSEVQESSSEAEPLTSTSKTSTMNPFVTETRSESLETAPSVTENKLFMSDVEPFQNEMTPIGKKSLEVRAKDSRRENTETVV